MKSHLEGVPVEGNRSEIALRSQIALPPTRIIKKENMPTDILTILWTDTSNFDIKEHENLQSAVLYLVANGAKYTNQEIVKKIDWLPKEEAHNAKNQSLETITSETKEASKAPTEDIHPPFPIPDGPPPAEAQPQVIGPAKGEYRPLSVSERLGPLAGMIGPRLMGD